MIHSRRTTGQLDSVDDLQSFVSQRIDPAFIKFFKMTNTFNATDYTLSTVRYWPDTGQIKNYFKSRLKFQIKHSLFRTKIQEGSKSVGRAHFQARSKVKFQFLNWVLILNPKS